MLNLFKHARLLKLIDMSEHVPCPNLPVSVWKPILNRSASIPNLSLPIVNPTPNCAARPEVNTSTWSG